MQELVIATQNPGKIAEIRALLAGVPVTVLGLDEAGGPFDEPPETGTSFEENAAMKARVYAEWTGRACLADDSGLEVDALDGRPGVDSAWYAYASEAAAKAEPREVRDPANIEKLLRELEGVTEERRGARFVCCMVLAGPNSGTGFLAPDGSAGFQPAPEPYDGSFKIHRRTAPHWQRAGATYFVTWRIRRGELSQAERQMVLDACLFWHGKKFALHAATVMPDHVHMLFRILPEPDGSWPELPVLLHSIKRYSALAIQRARGERGPFWQREYMDRIVRRPGEAEEKLNYIENNAVKAGLCEKAAEYPFMVRYPYDAGVDTGGARSNVASAGGVQSRLETGTTVRQMAHTRGTLEGRIGLPPRVPSGGYGFGYDPVFLVAPGHERTSAEMLPAEKNAISHRAMALGAMVEHIRSAV